MACRLVRVVVKIRRSTFQNVEPPLNASIVRKSRKRVASTCSVAAAAAAAAVGSFVSSLIRRTLAR